MWAHDRRSISFIIFQCFNPGPYHIYHIVHDVWQLECRTHCITPQYFEVQCLGFEVGDAKRIGDTSPRLKSGRKEIWCISALRWRTKVVIFSLEMLFSLCKVLWQCLTWNCLEAHAAWDRCFYSRVRSKSTLFLWSCRLQSPADFAFAKDWPKQRTVEGWIYFYDERMKEYFCAPACVGVDT